MEKIRIKTMTLLCMVCLCVALVLPVYAQGGGLFDSLLENTSEPTPASDAMAIINETAAAGKIYEAEGFFGPVKVEIVVDDAGKIESVRVVEHGEIPGFGATLIENQEIFDALVGRDIATAQIDVTTNATYTLNALNDTLKQAADEAVDNPLVTLTSIWGDGETIADTEHLVIRFDVSNLSMQQVLEKLEAVQQTGFVGMEWDSGILELRYPKQGFTPASTATVEHTEESVSNGAYAADNICNYCGGSGMCDHCTLGQCEQCFGEGEIWCKSCLGSGTCQSCYGSGGELRYMVGGDNQWVTCSRCGGGGMCKRCNGMGTTTCNYCHGSGNCAYCNGTGDCPYCHGTGTN